MIKKAIDEATEIIILYPQTSIIGDNASGNVKKVFATAWKIRRIEPCNAYLIQPVYEKNQGQ